MTDEYQVQIAASPGQVKVAKECTVFVEPIVEAAASGVTAGPASSKYRVSIGDRQFVIDARRAEERGAVVSWTLIDGQGGQRVIDVDGLPPDLKLSVAGSEALTVRANDSRDVLLRSGVGPGGAGSGELRAAMPGKVVKVLCKVGDVVKIGQGLLVIEAMKMENELRATVAGKVTTVSVREGQTVDGGQPLVTLSPE